MERCERRRLRTAAVTALLAVAGIGAAGLGCAFGEIHWDDPLRRGYTLGEAQHRYTELVRWSAFDKASVFVDPEQREAFLASAPSFRELRFTDYESGAVDIDDETGEATVEVTYYAYRLSSPLEIEVRETQRWARANVTNSWQVESTFVGLDELEVGDARH